LNVEKYCHMSLRDTRWAFCT